MKLSDLTIITSNKGKLAEINEILGTNQQKSKLDIPEIQSLNLDKVITEKAKAAYIQVKKPIMVEDVSLEIKSLNGLPGTFVKFFLETLGTEETVKLISKKSKEAEAISSIAIFNGKRIKIFKGKIKGNLISKERGENGFGFDKVFVPIGFKKTYAEMSAAEKNKISPRAKALRKLKAYLTS